MKWALILIGIGLACGAWASTDITLPAAAAGRVLSIGFLSSGGLGLAIALLAPPTGDDGTDAPNDAPRKTTLRAPSHAGSNEPLAGRLDSGTREDPSMPRVY